MELRETPISRVRQRNRGGKEQDMTNFAKLNKTDRAIARSAGLTADEINAIPAIGFNALGGGVGGKGIYLFDTLGEARAFVNDAPVSRDIVVF